MQWQHWAGPTYRANGQHLTQTCPEQVQHERRTRGAQGKMKQSQFQALISLKYFERLHSGQLTLSYASNARIMESVIVSGVLDRIRRVPFTCNLPLTLAIYSV